MPNVTSIAAIKNCCGILLIDNFFKNPDPYPETPEGIYARCGGESSWKAHHSGEWTIEKHVKHHMDLNRVQGAETREQYEARLTKWFDTHVPGWMYKKSYLILVLNKEQIKDKFLTDLVARHGFEVLVPETHNPTGSSVTLYIKHLQTKKEETKEVKSVLRRG